MLKTRNLLWLAGVLAVAALEMDMDAPMEFHPVNAGSKTFHWILVLFVLFLFPSITAVLTFAESFPLSTLCHGAIMAFATADTLFFRFPDNKDDHENRTSRGTGWFLALLLVATFVVGSAVNGSAWLGSRYKTVSTDSQLTGATLIRRLYKLLAVLVVLTGWVRVCMAPVALFGFCYGNKTGQCIAHGIMGSSFAAYGFILAWVLVIPWIRKRDATNSKSQEFWDSSLMCAWGIVNTFTEHRWGRESWSHGDYQHTAMGIIWWLGGLLGMWLSRKPNTRSVVPGMLLVYTGWAMSEHSQHLELSTKVHAMFGLTLITGGAFRIVEICFLLRDKAGAATILTFQHLPPLCLVLAGVTFMAANEEQLELVHDLGADHLSYIMVVASAGFLVYLWMLLMLALYLKLVGHDENGPLQSGYAAMAGGLEDSAGRSESPCRDSFELGSMLD